MLKIPLHRFVFRLLTQAPAAALGALLFCAAAGSASAGPIEGSEQWKLQQIQNQQLEALANRYRNLGNLPAANDPNYEDQLRRSYNDEAKQIKQRNLQLDTRGPAIDRTLEQFGYRNADGSLVRDRKGRIIGDIENTGSKPKDVRADVDLNAKSDHAAQRLAKQWGDQGHIVVKDPNMPWKIVNKSTDTTLWLPCDDECMKLKVHDPDAWTTEGGLKGTGNAQRIHDPEGYYLDNEKKFIHGQHEVRSGNFDEGLKTAAKSLDKAGKMAGIARSDDAIFRQAASLRDYGDPVEAGIANPTDSPELQRKKVENWLRRADAQMLRAKERLTQLGAFTDARRADLGQAILESKPFDPENQRMNEDGAKSIEARRERVRQSNEMVKAVNREAGGIGRVEPPERTVDKQKFVEASNEAQRQASSPSAGDSNPLFEQTRQFDKTIQKALGIGDDLSKTGPTRRQFNIIAQKWMPKIGGALDIIFAAKDSIEAGAQFKDYVFHLAAANDPAVSDAIAQQHYWAAQKISIDLMEKGAWGATLALAMKAFPTVGMAVGTAMISYQGGRFVLVSTRTGQFLDRTAGGTFDVALEAGDTLIDTMRGWLGGESRQMRAAADRQKLLESYRRALQEGRIALRKGWTFEDLETFVNADDLETIFDLVVDKSPAETRQQDEARARAEQEKVQRQAALARQQEEERLAAERARADQERAQRAAALARQTEEAAAAERARLEREGAAREQAARQQQAARAAADAACGRKKATLSGFNPSTGSYRCNCPQGMVVGVGDICVSQRHLAVSNCAKQNADLQSLDAVTGRTVCVCRSGMVYNLAKSACITQEARRAQDAGLCKANIPNSVFAGYDQGRPRCKCPQGWVWNGADKKSCVGATCPAGTILVSGNKCQSGRAFAVAYCRTINSALLNYDPISGAFKCLPPPPCVTIGCAAALPGRAAAPKPPEVDRRRGCDSTSRSAPAGSNPNLGC